jgi:site-specific DNA recombinase
VRYPDWRHYRCCSERCARRRYNRALALASSRARQKVCEVCGSEFVATRSDAKTCSPKCRQAAYRRRRLRQGE